MEKPSKQELKEWEDRLCQEGMAEVCLFDNTGKGHGVRFISLSQEIEREDEGAITEWAEMVNMAIYAEGRVVPFHKTAEYEASQAFSQAVCGLPPGWPARSRRYLESLANEGFRDGLRHSATHKALMVELGISRKEGMDIIRRFRQWTHDKMQCE